jgi:hypothetical protein
MIIGKIVEGVANTPAEGFAIARRIALEQGQRDAECSDPQTAARGRACVKLMPAFFDWMETELVAAKPAVATLGLASVMAAMLANVASACTDRETVVPWLEKVGTLIIHTAAEQMSGRGHRILVDRGHE